MSIKDRLKEYLDKISVYPDADGKYRCISGTHEDNHPSMRLHPSGTYLHCFTCGENFDIYRMAAWRLALPCDKQHFPKIAEAVEHALGIPSTWRPSHDERQTHYRKNRDAARKPMRALSQSAVYRDSLLHEMTEAVDRGNIKRAHEIAELIFALWLLPETDTPPDREPSWEEKELRRMAEKLAKN
jgi:hypothetical protein